MLEQMNEKLAFLVCLLFLAAASHGQDPQEKKVFPAAVDDIVIQHSRKTVEELHEDTSKISFEIQLARTTLLPLEPVIVKCNFTNRTGKTLEIIEPNLANNLRMKLRSGDGTDVIRKVFNGYVNGPSATRVLNPGETIEEFVMFEPGQEIFKGPGEYELQFFVSNGSTKVQSNLTTIIVNEPKGLDKEAYDFIRRNHVSEYDFFTSYQRNIAIAKSLLEDFASKFGGSRYYEYAVIGLSSIYGVTNQPEKAKSELLKLKSPKNELMTTFIDKRLAKLP